MKPAQVTGLLAGVLACVLMLSPQRAAWSGSAPQRGGTMVFGLATEPPTLNPSITPGAPDQLVGCMIYEGLVRIAFGFKIEPALAKSWEISPDGLTYTFHLVDAKWQDGTPFTSKDVAYSLPNISAKYGPAFAAAGRTIQSIETPDPATVVIRLSRPFGPFLMDLSCDLNGAILPEHIFKGTDVPRSQATLTHPVGTGPFELAEWAHGDHITLKRNPSYRVAGQPYLDRIIAQIMPNPPSRALALESGEIDYLNEYDFPQSSYKEIKANPALQTAESGFPSDFLIILNTKQLPLDKVKVRQALMIALDRNYIAKAVFSGLGAVAEGPFDTRIGWAYNPDVNYDKMYPYDPAKARALLDEAGVKPDSDGVRFSIDLVFDSTRQEYGPFSVALQQFWGAIGVKVNLVGAERVVVLKRVYGDYDFGATLQNYGTAGDPALGIARLYVTGSIRQGTTFNNVSRYSNPEVDKLFAEGQSGITQAARAVPYRAAQAILARDLPTLTINQMVEYNAASKKLHNIWLAQDQPFWSEVWIEH